jgi:hypothetical protein
MSSLKVLHLLLRSEVHVFFCGIVSLKATHANVSFNLIMMLMNEIR